MTKLSTNQSSKINQKTLSLRVSRFYFGLCLGFAAFAVYGSWIPFDFRHLSFTDAIEEFRQTLAGAWSFSGSGIDWSVNFMLMFPIAFLAMAGFVSSRSHFRSLLPAAIGVFFGCIVLSLAIEFGQLWSPTRVTSLPDIVAQTGGCLFGIVLYSIAGIYFDRWMKSFWGARKPAQKIDWILQAYVFGLIAYSLIPFDFILSPSELMEKLRSEKLEIVLFSFDHGSLLETLYAYGTQIALFLPVGMWSSTVCVARGQLLRPIGHSLLLGLLFVFTIECGQALIVGRYSSSTDLLLGTIGIGIGAFLMYFQRSRGAEGKFFKEGFSIVKSNNAALWTMAAFIYAFFLTLLFWAPNNLSHDSQMIQTRLESFVDVPFHQMHRGSPLVALFSVLRKFLWLLPLGVLVRLAVQCLWPKVKTIHPISIGVITLIGVFSIGLELVQALFDGPAPDITDTLIFFAGSMIGYASARTILLPPNGSSVSFGTREK